ncbi:ATP-binding protein [Variovorax sp. PAMC 28711]|uniref:ATP-binding protein n=1 Tax=Variovorax sp. PAMC 28711 TaxID=1795631 RepID=UPI00078CEFCC|nr:ATP-binding protein [Variovorax sp. PAMC 28711]AMM25589.1 hypothetical protein AX767_15405 [Variovorax sp. PAMC 28711]
MNAIRLSRPWSRLRAQIVQPTLQRRSVASVLIAFLAIWAVLLGYLYVDSQRLDTSSPGLDKFGAALTQSLAPIDDPAQASAAIEATSRWINQRRREIGRLPGLLLLELLDDQGKRIWASPTLRAMTLERPARQLAEIVVEGKPHAVYEGHAGRWTLRVVEPVRSDADFLSYNSRFLLRYLALALPFILLPVWWSVRVGLRPLQQFAEGIAHRAPDDLSPLALPVMHRELQPLGSAIDTLLERLRRKIDRERMFVQDAAHETRTPLAVVVTQAHVLAHSTCANARREAHEQLNRAIGRASHLTQQLLALAKLDDSVAAAPRPLDVAQACRQWLAQLVPAAIARGTELELQAPDRLVRAIDQAMLNSIVYNLVDNAIRYGRANGNVRVDLRDDGERLTLHVLDDGPGITSEDRARVFERFWRGNGQDASGSGLGLAIVRQAASRLGGKVVVTAGLGGGAGFLVSIPNPDFRAT